MSDLPENVREEIRAMAANSLKLYDFQEKLKKLAMRQAEEMAVEMFAVKASGLSLYQEKLLAEITKPGQEIVKKAMGVDSWGNPQQGGMLFKMIEGAIGPMVGAQLATVMEDPKYEERLRDKIKDTIRDKLGYIVGTNFERTVEHEIRTLLEKLVFEKP